MAWIILKRINVGVGTLSFVWDTISKEVKQVNTEDTIVLTSIGYSFSAICQDAKNTTEVAATTILQPTDQYIRATGQAITEACVAGNLVVITTVDMSPSTWPTFTSSDYTETSTPSASCGFIYDDIKITSITQADSGADKLITINASSSNGGLTYSLDGTTYQVSNQFTITQSGVYIAYVKDANGKTAQESFEVTLNEALYVERWSGEFDDDKENRYTVSIQELNYSGAVGTLSFSGVPAIISYPTDSDVYKPIRGSELVLGLTSETDYQFVDMFTAVDKKFRVKISTGGSVFWQGFISPEAYMEPYTCVPYDISLSFVDGLGVLKRRVFESPNGAEINTLRSDIDLLSFCLRQTGLELPIYTTVNIYEIQMGDFAGDPLSQTYINTLALEGKNVYEVLEGILQKWGACVYFEDNAWIIRNVDEIGQGAYPRRLYNYGGEYSSSDTYNPDVSITAWSAATRRAWVNGDMQLEMLPAFKDVKLTVNADTEFNIIPNGDFQQQEDNEFKFWTDDVDILEKAVILEGGKQKEVARIIGDYLILTGSIGSNLIQLQVNEGLIKFIFKIRFKVNAPETSLENEMTFQVRFNGTYCLFSTGLWKTSPANNIIGITVGPNEWTEYELETYIVPTDSSVISVTLFQAQSKTIGEEVTSVDIDYVELNYIEEGVKIENSKTYTATSDENYLAKESRNISFGDFQEYDNPGLVIKNTIFVDSGSDIIDTVNWFASPNTKYNGTVFSSSQIKADGDVSAVFTAGDEIVISDNTNQGFYTVASVQYPTTQELTNDPEFDSGGTWYLVNTAVTYTDGTAEIDGSGFEYNINPGDVITAGSTYNTVITISALVGTASVTLGGVVIDTISATGTYTYTTTASANGSVIVAVGSSSSAVLTFFSVKIEEDKTLITLEETTLTGTATCKIFLSPGKKSLIQILSERILAQRSRPIYKLSGTINGVLKVSNLVSDSNLAGKKFMITGYERDLRTRDHRVELVELQDTTDVLPYLIAEDGFYILMEDGNKILMEDAE